MDASCISYHDTGYFSAAVTDYLADRPNLRPFYVHRPTLEGFTEFFAHKKVTADRQLLVDVVQRQYNEISKVPESPLLWRGSGGEATGPNLSLLLSPDTYTITTGHQLNIFAGPLYFIYKIVTAIKLSQQLKAAFPDKNFVPVYWMATEDHDFAEINYTNIGSKKVQWQLDAKGATGRLHTDSIRQALNEYKGVLGMEGHGAELAEIMETAYTRFDTLAGATRYLVHALFGRYRLVVVDADDPTLKRQFAPIIEQDILGQHSHRHINESSKLLQTVGVEAQVNPREINFFYLTDNLRERITHEDSRYKVLNTDISFSADELKQEIAAYPERFSPNVVMRPLYQEVILPNAAYIGGGAELVYWLQLKSNFEYYGVDFPILILRNSALVMRREAAEKITRTGLKPQDFFKPVDTLKNQWIKQHSAHNLSLAEEWREFDSLFEKIKLRAYKIDPTLSPSAGAVQARLKHAISTLEKKLTRAEKRNYATRLEQIDHLRNELFPAGSLQERSQNFGLFYVKWGQEFIDELIRLFEPLDFEFSIISE